MKLTGAARGSFFIANSPLFILQSLACLALVGCTTDPQLAFGPAGDVDGGPFDTTVPPGGVTYYGGVDDIALAGTSEEHTRLSTKVVVDGANIDAAQQTRKV